MIKISNKVKSAIKNVFSALFCIFCLIFLFFSPIFIFDEKLYALGVDRFLSKGNGESVVLTLHHVETFEGGSASRGNYLKRQAIAYNKSNPNVFISVITMTPEQLLLNIKENNIPDIYSFGTGVGEYIAGYFHELDEIDTKSFLKGTCLLANGIYAYPYILSGYCLISNENLLNNNKNIDFYDENDDFFNNFDNIYYLMQSVNVGKKTISGVSIGHGYTCASRCVDINNNLVDAEFFDSSYDAYCNFVSGQSVSLLGTARDLARCKNRELNGKLSSCVYTPLSTYSDLVQYIGVVSHGSQLSLSCARSFAKFLTTQSAQKDLSKYGLFSTTVDKIYSDDYMSDFEDAYNELSFVPSAFISERELLSYR